MTTSVETWFSFLHGLELGDPIELHDWGLSLVPILDLAPRPLDASPLVSEIAHGRTRVTEVGDGRVDRVRVEHDGTSPLLILDGEEVRGAKQNRAFNASFLVAPSTMVELPVSCVEERRWHHTSPAFASSGRTVVTAVRATKLRRVATSVVERGEYDSQQREVWTGVSRYLERSNVVSQTRSYADAADGRDAAIDAITNKIALQPGQIGIAAVDARGRHSIDVFGAPGLLTQAWSVVARGLLADRHAGTPPPRPRDVIERCLRSLSSELPRATAAPGLGESLHVITEREVAGALAHDGRIYHLLAVSTDGAW